MNNDEGSSKILHLGLDNRNFETNAKTSLSTLDRLKQALNIAEKNKANDFRSIGDSIKDLFNPIKTLQMMLTGIGKIALLPVTLIGKGITSIFHPIKTLESLLVGVGKTITLPFKGLEAILRGLGSVAMAPIKMIGAGINSLLHPIKTLKNMLGDAGKIALFSVAAKEAQNLEEKIKSIVKSMTMLDQASAGWNKYSEKTTSVQTIMSATADEFSDVNEQMEYVNAQMDKLNWFTDETSYKFLDMVNNIGKFTNNQVPLDQAVTSMEGISVWAAKSGASVDEASRAMYNLAQAISVGEVKLMDWKSIENANMATAEFKQTAIDTAVELGTLTKASEGLYKTQEGHAVSAKNFNEYLQDGWFTSEVLLQTLDRYGAFTDKLHQAMEQVNEDFTTSEMLEYIDEYKSGTLNWKDAVDATGVSETQLKKMLEELGSEELEFGRKAFAAAQEAKTFTEAIDSVKDAVSTGWMNTFEIMFGDYLKAKDLWTDLANNLYTIFAEGGNSRNALLKEAFAQGETINKNDWKTLQESGIASPEYIKAIRESAKEHDNAMTKLLDDERWLALMLHNRKLTIDDVNNAYQQVYKSGLVPVNEGIKQQIETTKDSDESFADLLSTLEEYGAEDIEKVVFGDGKYNEGAEDLERALDQVITKLGLTQEDGADVIAVLKSLGLFGGQAADKFKDLSDEELSQLGWTKEQIAAFREAEEAGTDLDQVIDKINKQHRTTGDMWFDALNNSMMIAVELVELFHEEWGKVFPSLSASNISDFVKAFDEGTARIRVFIATSEELRTIIDGVASVIDILVGVFSMMGQLAFTSITSMLEGLGVDILDLAANVSQVVISFDQWLKENEVFQKVVSGVGYVIRVVGAQLRLWFDTFVNLPIVRHNLMRFKGAFEAAFKMAGPYLTEGIERIKAFVQRVKEMGGLKLSNIIEIFTDFKKNILDYFLDFPGFKSISLAFKLLWGDIKEALKGLGIDVDDLWGSIIAKFENLTWEDVVNTFRSIVDGIIDALETLELPESVVTFLEAVRDVFGSAKEEMEGLGDSAEPGIASKIVDWFTKVTDAISKFTSGVTLDSIMSLVKAFIAVKVIFSAIGIIKSVTALLSEMQKELQARRILELAASITLVAFAIGRLASLDQGSVWSSTLAIAFVGTTLLALTAALNKMDGGNSLKNVGIGLLAAVAALFVLIRVMKMLDNLEINDINGVATKLLVALGSLAAVMLISQLAGENAQSAAAYLVAVGAAFVLIAAAMKIIETIKPENIAKVAGITLGIGAMLAGLLYMSQYAKGATVAIGALAALVLVLSLAIAGLSIIDPKRLMPVTASLAVIIGLLAAIVGLAGYAKPSKLVLLELILIMGAIGALFYVLLQVEDVERVKTVASGIAEVFAALGILMLGVAAAGSVGAGAFYGLGVLGIIVGVLALVLVGFAALEHYIPGFAAFVREGIPAMEAFGEGIGRFVGSLLGGLNAGAMSVLPEIATYITGFMENLAPLNEIGMVDAGPLLEAMGAIAGISFAGFVDSLLSSVQYLENGNSAAEQFGADLEALSGALVIWQENMSLIQGQAIDIPTDAIDELAEMINKLSWDGFFNSLKGLLGHFLENKSGVQQFSRDLLSLSTALSTWQIRISALNGKIDIPEEGINSLVEHVGTIHEMFGGFFNAVDTQLGLLFSPEHKTAMEQFGTDVEGLGTILTNWNTNIGNLGTISVPTEAISALVTSLESIPNGGGIWQAFTDFFAGSPDVEAFSEQITSLGGGIKGFLDALGEGFDEGRLASAASSAQVLGELGTALKGQNLGGWFSDSDLTTFGQNLITFGNSLATFSKVDLDVARLAVMSTSTAMLSQTVYNLADTNIEDSDLSIPGLVDSFKTNIESLATAIGSLATVNTTGVDKFVTAAQRLAGVKFAEALEKAKEAASSSANEAGANTGSQVTQSIDSQASQMQDSGTKIAKAIAEGVSKSTELTSSLNTLLANAVLGIRVDAFRQKGTELASEMGLAVSKYTGVTLALKNMLDAATESIDTSKFTTAGTGVGSNFSHGINSSVSLVTFAVSAMVRKAKGAIETSGFNASGANAAKGFAMGITANTFRAEASARAMARAALNAANATLEVQSPSRAFYRTGDFSVQGYANALYDGISTVERASSTLANSAIDGINHGIAAIQAMLDSDLSSDPVIRPVLDLTDVQSGAYDIQNMLSLNTPIPVTGNLNAISGNMRASRDVVTNDDILAALTALRPSDIDRSGSGDVFNIDGVTYDDGTNVADAVRTLVRAVNVKRRRS